MVNSMQSADADAAKLFGAALAARLPELLNGPETPHHETFLADLFVACSPLRDILPSEMLRHQAVMQRAGHHAQHPHADRRVLAIDCVPVARIIVDWSCVEIVIVDIAVVPERQSAGIGHAALSAVLAVADTRARSVRLTVLRNNPAARLYARLGFVAVGDDGYDSAVDMIREPRAA